LLMLVLVPDVQPSHREEMLAARRRFQEQYDAQLKEAAKAKEDVSANALLLRNRTVSVPVFIYCLLWTELDSFTPKTIWGVLHSF